MKILFETAKLAKEKGFDLIQSFGNVSLLYTKGGEPLAYTNYGFMFSGLSDGYISGPTQSFLQKWLREEHDIHTSSFPVVKNRYYPTVSLILNFGLEPIVSGPYEPSESNPTYEEALEEALVTALKLIK